MFLICCLAAMDENKGDAKQENKGDTRQENKGDTKQENKGDTEQEKKSGTSESKENIQHRNLLEAFGPWIPIPDLARMIMIYASPFVVDRPTAHVYGIGKGTQKGQEVHQNITLPHATISPNGHLLLKAKLNRFLKLARGKNSIPLELTIPFDSFLDPPFKIIVSLKDPEGSRMRVRRLIARNEQDQLMVKSAQLTEHKTPHDELEIELDFSTLTPCLECRYYLPASMMEAHSKTCTDLMTCGQCQTTQTRHNHMTHLIGEKKECPLTPITCPYCQNVFPLVEYHAHTLTCPKTPVQQDCHLQICPQHRKILSRAQWAAHKANCEYRTVECKDCQEKTFYCLMDYHQNNNCPKFLISKRCDCCLDERQAPITLTRTEWKTHVCWRACIIRLEARIRALEDVLHK